MQVSMQQIHGAKVKLFIGQAAFQIGTTGLEKTLRMEVLNIVVLPLYLMDFDGNVDIPRAKIHEIDTCSNRVWMLYRAFVLSIA